MSGVSTRFQIADRAVEARLRAWAPRDLAGRRPDQRTKWMWGSPLGSIGASGVLPHPALVPMMPRA
ncbi:hypothetical protein A5792_27575 [Mycolicibacterium peregrinum]|uniref:Uncharacterized protein n=1 Tax=Mycolicibacterium peregrinum TaxID=43304 RepID=A0A1A0QX66_MYCPR|nr:hypothetical protein A5792_27575 [Mycolicibacterium peregrinum]